MESAFKSGKNEVVELVDRDGLLPRANDPKLPNYIMEVRNSNVPTRISYFHDVRNSNVPTRISYIMEVRNSSRDI